MSSRKEYILVTGGAGYIGSHATVELIQFGYNVVIVDNLVNSSFDAVARVEYIVQRHVPFHNVDICDTESLAKVFEQYNITSVIHFASLKAVGESTKIPLDYYANNVRGTINLLSTMKQAGVRSIVFSSSATVYGDATRFKDMIPIPETCPTGPTNPYGRTKLVIEGILSDLYTSDPTWQIAVLRYFNPIGAHASGLIGEDPLGVPNNLLPFLAQVAVGRRDKLSVFGNDFDSPDGTPIRDYIHVTDLARGHVSALEYLHGPGGKDGLYREWNLGTGKGSTVFDVFNAFCRAIGRELPYEVVGRRAGDVLNLTARPDRANSELQWEAKLSIDDACRDLWKWTTENPFGYASENYKWGSFNPGPTDKHQGITTPTLRDFRSRLHTVTLGDFKVSIANYGAMIQDVVLGGKQYVQSFDTLTEYQSSQNPYFGATIGRYANRIAKGEFQLDGSQFKVTQNEGLNSLHGGTAGYDKQYFLGPVTQQTKKDGPVSMKFVHVDRDGAEGFPADIVCWVTYTISKGSVSVEYEARVPEWSEKEATIVNLTNHSYFKVNSKPTIDGTHVQAATNSYLAVDSDKLPTGEINEFPEDLVSGHVLDSKSVFDHCLVVDRENWVLDTRKREPREIFRARDPTSRATIVFSSTEPCFQFYTGDGVAVEGREARCGFCIEPSRFIDGANRKEWAPQVVLRKGQVYGSISTYTFSE